MVKMTTTTCCIQYSPEVLSNTVRQKNEIEDTRTGNTLTFYLQMKFILKSD